MLAPSARRIPGSSYATYSVTRSVGPETGGAVHNSGVTYPVVADPMPMKAAIAYNLHGLPATFFLNARHMLYSASLAPRPPCRHKSWSKSWG